MHKTSCWFAFFALILAPLNGVSAQENDFLPDYYAETGLTDRATINDSPVEVIDPFTGHLTLAHTDVVVPGPGGLDIAVVRAYSSLQDYNSFGTLLVDYERSPVGLGWTMHFGRILLPTFGCQTGQTVANNPVYQSPDGHRKMLFRESTGVYLSKDRWRAECTGGAWTVWAPDGTMLDLGYQGQPVLGTYAYYATKITDRNFNEIDISYERSQGLPYVTQVDASDGRRVTFTYSGVATSTFRLTRVSSEGRNWDYTHTSAPSLNGFMYLTRVDRPDGRDWDYAYHPTSASAGRRCISRVTYPYGATIDYDYDIVVFDSGYLNYKTTVVDRKDVGGTGGIWTFTYSPGTSEDTTTIDSPYDRKIYKHYGARSASIGTAWRVGLVKSIQVREGASTVQTTTFDWASTQISDQRYVRAPRLNIYDNSVFAPRMTRRTISRNGTHVTNYSNFDAYDNPGSVTESGPNGESRSTSVSYFTSPSRWIVRGFVDDETISGVGTISRSFDSDGNLLSENRFGRSYTFTYHPSGDLKSVREPNGSPNTTLYSNYYRGTARSISAPESVTIARGVNSDGTVRWVRNGRGDTTNYTYDALGRMKSIDPPTGSTTNITYNTSTASPTVTSTRGGLSEVRDLDGFGRVVEVSTEGITTTFTLDLLGRKTFESYPDQSSGTSYDYDPLDRLQRVTHGDGSYRSYSYSSGNRMTVTDERDKRTTYTYQSFGNPSEQALTKIVAPESQTTDITRNEINLVKRVEQGGKTRTYNYDSQFRLTSAVHPELGTVTYGRDANGNMTWRRVGGRTTNYGYDNLNRLESIDYPAGTNDVTYTYDKNNNVTDIVNGIARREYEYTKNDVLDEERLIVLQPTQRTFVIDYTINALDQVTRVIYPVTGHQVDYAPDDLGRPTRAGSLATSLSWHPTGQLQSMTLGNGRRVAMSFDNRMRIATMRTTNASAANEIDFGYTYDDANNMTRLDDKRASAPDITMTYDDLGRLETADGNWGDGSLTYSTTGNISSYQIGGDHADVHLR